MPLAAVHYRIPQAKVDWFIVDHDIRGIVVETSKATRRSAVVPRDCLNLHCWDVFTRTRKQSSTSVLSDTYGNDTHNALVVYDMSRHVLPTAPSPTTTHLTFR